MARINGNSMCGRFTLANDLKTSSLLKALQVAGGEPLYSTDQAPGSQISIVRQGEQRCISNATWWLFLDPLTLKPNTRYASFNSRWDKLNAPHSIAYRPYRESRCIIPASAFCEGLGDKKAYHKIELLDQAIAFGGLYRTHIHPETGKMHYSASIITLPPVNMWSSIHPKPFPLILDTSDGNIIDKWLNPAFTDVEAFAHLGEPDMGRTQCVTPTDKASKWNSAGESFLLA